MYALTCKYVRPYARIGKMRSEMAKTGQKQVIFQKTSFWPVFANLDHTYA
jgi:hypothetical protein